MNYDWEGIKTKKSAQTTLGMYLIMMRTNKMRVIIKLIKTIRVSQSSNRSNLGTNE